LDSFAVRSTALVERAPDKARLGVVPFFVAEVFVAEAFLAEAFVAEAFVAEAFVAEAFVAEAFVAEALDAEALDAEALDAGALIALPFVAGRCFTVVWAIAVLPPKVVCTTTVSDLCAPAIRKTRGVQLRRNPVVSRSNVPRTPSSLCGESAVDRERDSGDERRPG
jgi:hypothetical protein